MSFTTIKKFLFNYYYYLQILVLAFFLYLLVWLLVNYVPPALLANWFWADSYFLFQITFGAANFFFFTFLLQNRRLGAWLALTIFSVLFFQFSHFVWTWPLILALLISSFLMFFWFYLAPRLKKHPLFSSQNPSTSKKSPPKPVGAMKRIRL